MLQDHKQMLKEYEEAFGVKAMEKVQSHVLSLYRALEDMEASRNNWKNKYIELKKRLRK